MGVAVLSSSTMVLFFAVITLAPHLFCFLLQVIKMVVSFLSYQWKEYVSVNAYRKVIQLSTVILNTYHSYHIHTKFIPHSSLKMNSIYWSSSMWILTD